MIEIWEEYGIFQELEMVRLLCIYLNNVWKIKKDLKILQMDSNIFYYDPIYQWFWTVTLMLTSGYPVYHKCQWLQYLCQDESSLFGKILASVCSVPADDFLNGVFGTVLAYFRNFMKEMEWLKKTETEDLVEGIDEYSQKLDVVVVVIFTFIANNNKSVSK